MMSCHSCQTCKVNKVFSELISVICYLLNKGSIKRKYICYVVIIQLIHAKTYRCRLKIIPSYLLSPVNDGIVSGVGQIHIDRSAFCGKKGE